MSGPTPRAPTLIDVQTVLAPTIDAPQIGQEAQLDQVGDRRPGGESGGDAREQAPDEKDGQSLPPSQDPAATSMIATAPSMTPRRPTRPRDAGLQEKGGNGARCKDGVDHCDRE